MRKYGYRYLVWLSLILLAALFFKVPAARTQPGGLFSNFTFGFYGNNQEAMRQDREDLIARQGYCPTGGCVLRLDRVEIKPSHARPGATLLLKTTYTILTPEQVGMPISITREIFYHGKSLGLTKSIDSSRLNGTWEQEINFTLPANAAPGIYSLVTLLKTPYGTAMDSSDFQVE